MYRIIQKRNIFFILSAVLLIPGILSLIFWGLPMGIDFKGGSLIQVSFKGERPSSQNITEKLSSLDLGHIAIQQIGEKDVTMKLKHIDNETYQKILQNLKDNFGEVEEISFEAIGPTIGKELGKKAIIAVIIVLVCIIIYISFAFRKVSTGPVPAWVFGTSAVISLMHDILMVIGIFSIISHFFHFEIDTLFVTAVLTVIGFSNHDTVVVFDRIRERLKISYAKNFEDIVNESINQTLVRSISTSFTTLLVLLALYLFGGESIKNFILVLLIGITSGTYSSIFVASPLLVVWDNIKHRKTQA